jgi:predicted Fe-S protein YdhL (DUF1289 family)
MTVNSPCIDVCQIEYDIGLCVGCLRSRMEIENWSVMSDENKLWLLDVLKERRDWYGED